MAFSRNRSAAAAVIADGPLPARAVKETTHPSRTAQRVARAERDLRSTFRRRRAFKRSAIHRMVSQRNRSAAAAVTADLQLPEIFPAAMRSDCRSAARAAAEAEAIMSA